ncbi:MAG: hypothetical protein AVDCRST_MAG17-452 [uncultured Solirubrobacterales bacterium]|uniref:Uncharacterized protein n=1 Tax=uncultured Solirubrobacterales bacterium TaxID=768556 RepID=A0A6J4S0A4_9ACTN|nr:MAG: hypothetical protein AVDCRST_MAG17-452 [uncultured Solirubrobacterales bacterium]
MSLDVLAPQVGNTCGSRTAHLAVEASPGRFGARVRQRSLLYGPSLSLFGSAQYFLAR